MILIAAQEGVKSRADVVAAGDAALRLPGRKPFPRLALCVRRVRLRGRLVACTGEDRLDSCLAIPHLGDAHQAAGGPLAITGVPSAT